MQLPAVQPYDVRERSSVVVTFFHKVPPGLSLDEVMKSAYWRNAWKVFENRVYSTIDLVAEDNTWEAQVRILSAANGDVVLRLISQWAAPKSEVPAGYTSEHVPGQGWRLLDSDGLIVTEGAATEADAIAAAKPRRKPAEPRRAAALALKD